MKFWSEKGGLPIFGFPISAARTEHNPADNKDYLVQYFERNRFEYHPEFAGTNNEVLLGLLGVQWTFEQMVRPGDTLSASIVVLDTRTTRRPDRGIVTLRLDISNQHRLLVQTGHCQIMFKRRPAVQTPSAMR